MGDPATKKATYADLLEVPDTMVAELIDGVLHTMSRPGPAHANTASVLGSDLGGPFHRKPGGTNGPGGWWVIYEPELHLGEDVLVPDAAAWRRERMPRMPSTAHFTVTPDWVCEISSPSTVRIDRIKKMDIYAREQVPFVWLVDPLAKLVEIYRLNQGLWVRIAVHGGDDRARLAPFEQVEIELERWWLADDEI